MELLCLFSLTKFADNIFNWHSPFPVPHYHSKWALSIFLSGCFYKMVKWCFIQLTVCTYCENITEDMIMIVYMKKNVICRQFPSKISDIMTEKNNLNTLLWFAEHCQQDGTILWVVIWNSVIKKLNTNLPFLKSNNL